MEKERNEIPNSQEKEINRDEAVAEGVTEYVSRKEKRGKEGLGITDRGVALGAAGLIVAAIAYPAAESYFSNRNENSAVIDENNNTENADEEAVDVEMPDTIVVDGKTYTIEMPEAEKAEEKREIEFKDEIGTRAEIEAERTYKFSQLVARINHYPEKEERDGIRYWDVNKSAGQVTVTRPYGEMSEKNPHNEAVEFEFYPNDEQAIFEWQDAKRGPNLPSGAFWLNTDSTGGKVKIEFFDENGEVIKKHKGEMVMAEWTDTNGETRQAIQFKDEISGETRPAAFQTYEMIYDENNEAVDIEYPYHTAKVTMEPTPGSYMQLNGGGAPTIPFGPEGDQGFGFYLWEK